MINILCLFSFVAPNGLSAPGSFYFDDLLNQDPNKVLVVGLLQKRPMDLGAVAVYLEDTEASYKGKVTLPTFAHEEGSKNALYAFYVRGLAWQALDKGQELSAESERLTRWLNAADVYADEYKSDYKAYMKGIWALVSLFDREERQGLCRALQRGQILPADEVADPDDDEGLDTEGPADFSFPKDEPLRAFLESLGRA